MREESKVSITITGQAAVVKPHPKITVSVFAIGRRQAKRGQSVRFRVSMKGFGRTLPTNDSDTQVARDANPHVAARVFKQTKDIVTGKDSTLPVVAILLRCVTKIL